jgi:hypothetical protein
VLELWRIPRVPSVLRCTVSCCRAFLDEVVREPVELGYGDWGPPAPTPTRGDVQMSPLGGGSGPGPAQTAGEWSGASQVQYGSGELQPQYANTNGNTTQYARAASGTVGATPGAARSAPAAGDQPPPPAAGSHNQVGDTTPYIPHTHAQQVLTEEDGVCSVHPNGS